MRSSATVQILLQPWLDRLYTGRPWLLWILLAAALIFLMVGLAALGAWLAMVLIPCFASPIAAIWWQMLAESAAKQNTSFNAHLLPGFERRLMEVLLPSYVAASVLVGVTIAIVAGRFTWVGWNAAGVVAVVALMLACIASSFRYPYAAVGLIVIPLGVPRLFDAIDVQNPGLFEGPVQLALALIALTAGAISLVLSYRRPDAASKWAELWATDKPAQQRQANFFYRWALRRAIDKKDHKALIAHATGPGAHWTFSITSVPVFLVVVGLLWLLGNPLLWLFAAIPVVVSSGVAAAVSQAVFTTRAEQNLVVLVPRAPRGAALNRSLLRSYTATFACALLISLSLYIPLIFLMPAPYSKPMLAHLAIVASIPPILWIANDYANMHEPTLASLIAPPSAGLGAAAVLFVTYDLHPAWVPEVTALLIAAVCALLWLRWRHAVRAPSFFPAGQLMST